MKKLIFMFALMVCMFSIPMTGFAAPTDEEKQQYEDAISDKWKEMLKGSIELDKMNAENKESLLTWLDTEKKPAETKKTVEKIRKLEAEQAKDQESMNPYLEAKKTCDEKLNADGANAALENIIRIQKDRLSDQKELAKLWKKVMESLQEK